MKSIMKMTCVVMVVMLFCSSSVMAWNDMMWLSETTTGGDWSNLSIWEENAVGNPATHLPDFETLVYAAWHVTPASPLYIPADYTAYAEEMYATDTKNVDGFVLDIYGSLVMTTRVMFGVYYDGLPGDPPTSDYGEATINIYPGAYVNIPWTQMYHPAHIFPHEGNIVQTGGLAEIGFFYVNCYDLYKALMDYDLQGGILHMNSILSYDVDNDDLGDYISLDIDGGEWVMPSYWVDRLIADGAVLASGTAVTPANKASLLYTDDITYRGIGKVGVSLGSGSPSDASALYTGRWTMDDNAANTTVADSTGSNDGTFSDATGIPNTSAHHNADAVEGTGSLEFDGVDDYVTLPRDTVLETGSAITHELSVSAWIKHDTSADNNATIVGTGTGGWFLGTVGTADTISFICSLADPNGAASETVTVTDTTPVFDGQWHHIVATLDGSGLDLYVDDNHESSETTLLVAALQNGGDNAVLIGENAGSTGSHWKGLIDDVRIYQFTLSSEEVYHWHHPKYAWNPNYPNGAWWVDPNDAVLEWSAGDGADSHDVYFGKKLKADIANDDGLNAVNVDDLSLLATGWLADEAGSGLAEPSTIVDFADFAVLAEEWGQEALVFQGNTTDPNFVASADASPLEPGIWLWRIDEIDDDTSTTYAGRVWGFIIE